MRVNLFLVPLFVSYCNGQTNNIIQNSNDDHENDYSDNTGEDINEELMDRSLESITTKLIHSYEINNEKENGYTTENSINFTQWDTNNNSETTNGYVTTELSATAATQSPTQTFKTTTSKTLTSMKKNLLVPELQLLSNPKNLYKMLYLYWENKIINKIPDGKCKNQMELLKEGLHPKGPKNWALQMIDASSKINSGLMSLNLASFGDPDECLKISEYVTESEHIKGKYCLLSISGANENLARQKWLAKYSNFLLGTIGDKYVSDIITSAKVIHALCIPSECRADSFQNIFSAIESLETSYNNLSLKLNMNEDFCYIKEDGPLSTLNVVSLSLVLGLAIIVALFTSYDVLKKTESHQNIVRCFSLRENCNRIFFKKSSENSISCLNGIKVIAMLHIFFAHEFKFACMGPVVNNRDILQKQDSIVFTAAYVGTLAVDTFFVISGMLVVRSFLRSNSKKMSPLCMYIKRYIRLMPVLIFTILFRLNDSLICKYYSPTYCPPQKILQYIDDCHNYWWSTILLVQNYVHMSSMCVRTSWFLAVDSQLYLLSPILLYTLTRRHKLAIIGSILLIFISSTVLSFLTYMEDLEPLVNHSDQTAKFYVATHFRFGPWLIGALFGYVIHRFQNNEKKLSKITLITLWIVSLILMLVVPIYIHNRKHPTAIEKAILNGFGRQIWGFGVSIIIFLCAIGKGGMVQKFLSLPIFRIGCYVNYTMYLTHFYVAFYIMASRRTAWYFDGFSLIHNLFGDFMISYIFSLVITLIIEMPFTNLGQLVIKHDNKNLTIIQISRGNKCNISTGSLNNRQNIDIPE